MFQSLVESIAAQRHLNWGLRCILESASHSEEIRRKIKVETETIQLQFRAYREELLNLLSDDNCIHLAGTLPRIRVLLDDPLFEGDLLGKDGSRAAKLVQLLEEIDDLVECIQFAASYDVHRNCPEVEYLLSGMKLEVNAEGYVSPYT